MGRKKTLLIMEGQLGNPQKFQQFVCSAALCWLHSDLQPYGNSSLDFQSAPRRGQVSGNVIKTTHMTLQVKAEPGNLHSDLPVS